MSDVEELVAEARRMVATILDQATTRLLRNSDIRDVQPIVDEAARCLEDVEAYALLAGGADRDAEAAITREVARLRELEKALRNDQGR